MNTYEYLIEQYKSENKEISKAAEDCLTIHQAIKNLYEGRIWHTLWQPMYCWAKIGNATVIKPSKIGEIFLKGLYSTNKS